MAAVDVLAQVSEHSPVAAPARSVRRATARRASARRAYARSRHRDDEASIVAFLANHPHSTVGDLAKSLNLDTGHVATCLLQLTRAGEIQKASDGYSSS
jgi:DNA-binding MarR family transcriptional regulator